ncbi:hypothetical protein Tco_0960585 [Tanacetum coccineum]
MQKLRYSYGQKQFLPHVTPKIVPSENLGKLQPKADIGIFIGYAPTNIAFRIYNRRTRRIIETIHVDFDELTAMTSEQSSLGPALHEMTPATISSGLVPNLPPSTLFVPPSRTDWDILFQLMFDELLTPSPSVDHPAPKVIAPFAELAAPVPAVSTGSPSSTTVDQDAPSPIANMGNDPYFGIPIPEVPSDQSSSTDSIHTIMHPDHQISKNNSKWTKDHPLENIIGELDRPISIRLQLHEQALFSYYDAFLTAVKPKTYKDALTQSCWIKAMQEVLNEFERLEVWKLVPQPDKVMVITLKWIYKVKLDELRDFSKGSVDPTLFIRREGKELILIFQNPRGIFINQSKYALESLKKYSFDSCDLVDTPMVEKSKLDEDKEGKAIDPSQYRGMIGTLLYLIASRPDLQFSICMCAQYQARPTKKHLHAVKRIFLYLKGTVNRGLCTYGLGYSYWEIRLLDGHQIRQENVLRFQYGSEYIAMSGCCAQILWMRSQLTDYGLGFNKIPMFCDKKSLIALCCNNVQHSRSKHIDIKFHFIKEHVENGVIELYFVNTKYQLADIFTKALGRERIEFLINKLGMRSFTPETLKQLADEVDE